MPKRDTGGGGRGFRGRAVGLRPPTARFLIVSEGEKTEKLYFEAFEVPGLKVHAIGTGRSSIDVVREAVKQRERSGLEFAQVWCVFDRDQCTSRDCSAAFELAERQGIRVAFSNIKFELWFLLHFMFFETATRSEDYDEKLSDLLGHEYNKNSPTIYAEIADRQETAIANAARLLALYERPNPHEDNPSTTVHLLVIELNKYRRR
jgi:hypothetical protein